MVDIFNWKEPTTWPHDWKEHADGIEYFDTHDTRYLIDEFRERYSHIVCYHGCRPQNVDMYYKKGLIPSSTDKLQKTARKLFLGPKTSWVTKEELEKAEAKLGQRDNGNLFVVLHDEELIHDAGHYCIYGSERLFAVANMLDAKEILRSVGKPTMLKANAPVVDISDNEIDMVIKAILRELPLEDKKPCWIDHTILLHTSIAPENVIAHYHPEEILDQHEDWMIYRYKQEPEYVYDPER